MTLSVEKKLIKARANLVMAAPFFGTLALRMKFVPDTNIKTGSCDGQTIRYNPEYIDKMPLSKVQGFVAHSVMHPAMLHHTRRGNRDKKTWNAACDYAINSIIEKAGFDLPEGRFTNPSYDGMTAEHIYTLIPPGNNGNQGGSGNGESGEDDSGNDPGGDGGVEDSPSSQNKGGSQSQQSHEEAEWKVAVAQAAHAAKQAGKLPAGIDRMMEDIFEPVLPWRDILRRFMTEKANDDFSWRRGNRRFIAAGLYLPSRTSDDAMGEIVVVIDTSGSIGQKELDEFGSEIKGIIEEARPSKTHVVYCDAAVAHVDTFAPDDEITFKIHGGGGTDFRPPFEWVRKNGIDPRCLVYLTDGYGDFPQDNIPYPVMWCINNDNVIPPMGEHLILEIA
jgi:predicted metal-dependent peptidase